MQAVANVSMSGTNLNIDWLIYWSFEIDSYYYYYWSAVVTCCAECIVTLWPLGGGVCSFLEERASVSILIASRALSSGLPAVRVLSVCPRTVDQTFCRGYFELKLGKVTELFFPASKQSAHARVPRKVRLCLFLSWWSFVCWLCVRTNHCLWLSVYRYLVSFCIWLCRFTVWI